MKYGFKKGVLNAIICCKKNEVSKIKQEKNIMSVTEVKFAKNVPFNFVNGTLTLIVGGKQYQLGVEDVKMAKVKEMITEKEPVSTEDDLVKLLASSNIENYVNTEDGKAFVKDSEVYFNGEVVHTSIAQRIKDCMNYGLPFDNMLRFMENIAANPSYQSQKELFDFLTNKSLPITTDGCFLAYKAVRSDFYDKFSGKFFNGIGQTVKMSRPKVDDDRRNECSFGLHVGALEYVRWYGNSNDKYIYVKVNPKDVVSVPLDHHAQKVRVCEYTVLEEFKGELTSPVYDDNLNALGQLVEKTNVDWSDEDDEWGDDWQYEPTYYDDEDEYEDDEDEFDDDNDWLDDEYGCGINDVQPQVHQLASLSNQLNPVAVDKVIGDNVYGVKPNGRKFYNFKGPDGKWVKVNN